MKKYFILFVLMAAFTFTNVNAKTSTMVGGGLAYGTDIKKLAIQAGAIFDIDAPVNIAPDFKYYFTDQYVTFWELNVNVHYDLTKDKGANYYLLGGLNYAVQSVDFNNGFAGSGSVSNSEIGLNIGGGAKFAVSGFYIVPEIKYVLSNYNQLVLGVSAMFPI